MSGNAADERASDSDKVGGSVADLATALSSGTVSGSVSDDILRGTSGNSFAFDVTEF